MPVSRLTDAALAPADVFGPDGAALVRELKGASVDKLYREGKAWLAGSEEPGDPHWP